MQIPDALGPGPELGGQVGGRARRTHLHCWSRRGDVARVRPPFHPTGCARSRRPTGSRRDPAAVATRVHWTGEHQSLSVIPLGQRSEKRGDLLGHRRIRHRGESGPLSARRAGGRSGVGLELVSGAHRLIEPDSPAHEGHGDLGV